MDMVSKLGQHLLNSSSFMKVEFLFVEVEKWNSLSVCGSISLVQFPSKGAPVSLMISRLGVKLNKFSGMSLNLFPERSRYVRVLLFKTVELMSSMLHSFMVRYLRLGSTANAFGMIWSVWLKVELTIIIEIDQLE